jgi:hypothetical protein
MTGIGDHLTGVITADIMEEDIMEATTTDFMTDITVNPIITINTDVRRAFHAQAEDMLTEAVLLLRAPVCRQAEPRQGQAVVEVHL